MTSKVKTQAANEDQRERVITLGEMAAISMQRGEHEEALKLLEEAAGISSSLNEISQQDDILWDMGQILLMRQEKDEAIKRMKESYLINQKTDNLEKYCTIGQTLGYLLCLYDNKSEGIPILECSLQGFKQLSMRKEQNQTKMLLMQFQ